jgi:thiol-disulfide isomerase/thioredoxin
VKQLGRFWVLALAVLGVGVVYYASPYISEMVVGHSLTKSSEESQVLPPPQVPARGLTRVLGRIDSSWTFTSIDGQKVPFESFRGKGVFVNLWATWCGPCVMEMPGVLRLYESTPKDQVQFVLLSTESLEITRAFVAGKGWQAPFYVVGSDLPSSLDTRGIPATFLINKRGEIVFREEGAAGWDSEEAKQLLRDLVQQ